MYVSNIETTGKIKVDIQIKRSELLQLLNAKTDCLSLELPILKDIPIQIRVWTRNG